MKRAMIIISAALAFAGAAFSLEVPEAGLLLRFFRERLDISRPWAADSRCLVISSGDTILETGIDTIGLDIHSGDYASSISPFAATLELLCEPIEIAVADIDSAKVNKTRTRVEGIMCWKLKIYRGEDAFSVYLTGDSFFRILLVERKGRGKSKSDDVWEFAEVSRGRDLPKCVTRSVVFQWGGEDTEIISKRELGDFRVIGVGDEP